MKYLLLFFLLISFGKSLLAEEVNFQTEDHASIYANFFPRSSHAVLLAHGAIFNKESWGDFEQQLLQENYTVLAIDFRGYNKSTLGEQDRALHQDILAGVKFLREQKEITKVTVLGASMGGGAAAKASVQSQPNTINQLILLSPAQIFKPEALKGEILFIFSQDEYLAKKINATYEKAPVPKQRVIIDGKAHAQHIFKTSQAKNLTSIILKFLQHPP